MKFSATTLALIICFLNIAKAADAPSQRALAIEFFRKNIVGRTVASPSSTFLIDGGKVQIVSEEQSTITGFVETPEGFVFDLTSVSKATGQDVGPAGKPTGPVRDYSGVRVYRYEVKELRCSKSLLGFGRLVSTTAKGKDPTGQYTSVRIKVADGKLILSESTPDYVDFISTNGTFKPGGLDTVSRYSLYNGKLRLEQDMTLYDVDPETLKRTLAKDKLPTDVFNESDGAK